MRSLASTLALTLLLLAPLVPQGSASHETYYPTCQGSVGRDIVLVIDRSSSMLDDGKFAAAKTAATALLSTLSTSTDQSGLVSFASWFSLDKGLNFNHAQTQSAVTGLVASGATNLGGAVKLARHELDNGLPSPAFGAPYSGNARANAEHIMIVLSDGEPTYFTADALSEANHAKSVSDITMFTIGLGNMPPLLLSQMASSPAHFYMSPDANQLLGIFQQISAKLNDTLAPTVTINTPHATNHQLFHNYAAVGPSQLAGVSTASSGVTVSSTAGDDCLVDRVDTSIRVGTTTVALGSDHTSPFTASFDCSTYPPGQYTITAKVYDWLNKTNTTTRDIVCVRAHVDSQATAFYARLTNPADPRVRTEGARLPATLPGADTHDVLTEAETAPFPYDISLLHDEVNGSLPLPGGSHRYAQSLSRSLNATFVTLGLDMKVLETRANAQADADPLANPLGAPTRLAVSTSGGVLQAKTGNAQLDDALNTLGGALCMTDMSSQPVSITRCGTRIDVDVGVTVILGETITVTGPWWREITVNGAHVLIDRPDMRGEIILSQSYAGASWIGSSGLLGPRRTLDVEDDAGSGADAPAGLLAANALPLTPGVYGARVATPQDVDAYAFTLTPGKKIHALVAVSDVASVEIGTLSPLPAAAPADVVAYATSIPSRATTATMLPALTVRLLDPSGVIRDVKGIPAGAAQAVELNVDRPGDWTVIVSASNTTAKGDYTLVATIVDAPMTSNDDAFLGADAGGSCASATLVGPGAHVGTLEDGDLSDWYRFQLEEGQVLALVLRPGDTLEAADMRLTFYDRACKVAAYGLVVTGLVKGSPESVTFNVPSGASGIYRAHVAHVNGIGTYELAIATSIVATP